MKKSSNVQSKLKEAIVLKIINPKKQLIIPNTIQNQTFLYFPISMELQTYAMPSFIVEKGVIQI